MPLLSISVFLPLLGGVLLMALPNKSARIAHGVSIATTGLTFVVTLAIWARGTLPDGFAQVEEIAWIPAIGAAYRVGVDGLSLPLILLTSLLFFLSAIYAARITDRPAVFVALMLMLETASIGTFAALDARSGTPLWHFQANQDWKASPMTYMVGGRQYVAIASGLGFWAFALPD